MSRHRSQLGALRLLKKKQNKMLRRALVTPFLAPTAQFRLVRGYV
jgi:hypothetical protein